MVENVASDPGAIVFFDRVTPARVSSFYAQALPRAGYTITVNSVISQSGGTVAFIQFTGHGVKAPSTRCPSSPTPPSASPGWATRT